MKDILIELIEDMKELNNDLAQAKDNINEANEHLRTSQNT